MLRLLGLWCFVYLPCLAISASKIDGTKCVFSLINLRLMFHNNDNAWHIRHALRYLSAIYSANIECNETINIAQQYPIEASKLHRTKTKRSTSQRFHERQNWCVAACCSHRRRWPIYTKSIFWIVVFRAHNDARCLARGAARSPQGV